MAKTTFKVGDEVAVLVHGEAWRITTILGDYFGNGWRTGETANGATCWSKTGLGRDVRYRHQRIVPATDEHRRTIRIRALRAQLSSEDWSGMPAETIEAVVKVLGLAQ